MFRDVNLGAVRFKSRSTTQTATASTLTMPIEMRESDAQTDAGSADAGTQTDTKTATSTSSSSSKNKESNSAESEEERQRALQMLARVGPTMLRELAQTGKTSSVFAGTNGVNLTIASESLLTVCDRIGLEKFLAESEEKEICKLMTLKFDFDAFFQQAPAVGEASKAKKETSRAPPASSLNLQCTGVSWNATGSVIAVAYGRFDHTGWCNYRSALCLWKVFQADFNPTKPNLVLETSVSPGLPSAVN